MNESLTIAFILLAMFCGILLSGALYHSFRQQIRDRHRAFHRKNFSEKYAEAIYRFLNAPVSERVTFPGIRQYGSRLLLAKISAGYASLIYGYDRRRMEQLIHDQHLDQYLIRRARRTHGIQRASAIRLLSLLPLKEKIADKTGQEFIDDHNRYVRLYALLLLLGHFPDRTIELLAAHPYRLGDFELSEVAMLLRNRFVPPDIWKPMLVSNDRNLILLGLGFIRFFQIDTAQERIIAISALPDPEIQLAALRTLAELHASLQDDRIADRIITQPSRVRKQLYLLLASEGYSLHALSALKTREKDKRLIRLMEQAVNSHKRSLNRNEAVNCQLS